MKTFKSFKERNILSKEAMLRIGGGCGYKTKTGTIECNVSKVAALFMVEDGGHWCCESCASSSYCG